VKHPLGILEDVPTKVGDFCVLNDFILLDMAKDAYTQIILRRLFLATSGCKIHVKRGRLTFDVGEYHADFNLLEHQRFSPCSFACDEVTVSQEIEKFDDLCPTDPPVFDCVSTKGLDLDYARNLLPLCHLT